VLQFLFYSAFCRDLSANKMNDNNESANEKEKATSATPLLLKILEDMLHNSITKRKNRYIKPGA
jgi:hypothetical protein